MEKGAKVQKILNFCTLFNGDIPFVVLFFLFEINSLQNERSGSFTLKEISHWLDYNLLRLELGKVTNIGFR